MSAATVTPPPQVSPTRRPAVVTAPSPPVRLTYGLDPTIYRFTGEQYDRMVAAGILGPEDKVELLEGNLVTRMAKNEPHESAIDLAREALTPLKPAGHMLRCQQVLVLPESRPEPDFALVRGTPRSYTARHPTAADALLVIEVADTSRGQDLTDKASVYAAAGVPMYWVVDLPARRIVVHSQPRGASAASYMAVLAYFAGDQVPLVLDGVTVAHIPAADLLP